MSRRFTCTGERQLPPDGAGSRASIVAPASLPHRPDPLGRNLLRQAISLQKPELEVDIDHLMEYNDQLTNELLQRPGQHIPLFEKAALEAAISMAMVDENRADDLPEIQVTLTSTKQPTTIRQLLSGQVRTRPARVPIAPAPSPRSPHHQDPESGTRDSPRAPTRVRGGTSGRFLAS